MKPLRFASIVFGLIVCAVASGHAQDMDSELSNLATNLASLVKGQAKKKIAVIDFTDLDGKSSELGKYVAEQLTVNLVMVRQDFSVLDRANLKKVLAEHKLTATGLIDPDNAKKLGQFAGVDAIILGTITEKKQNVALTAKIITTDTAEIVGASRVQFPPDETVQQLATKATSETESYSSSETHPASLASQKFNALSVTLDSLIRMDDGSVRLSFTLQNPSSKNSVAVAMYHDPCSMQPCWLRSSLVTGDGTKFFCDDGDISGIGSTRFGAETLTEIEPGKSAKMTMTFRQHRWSSERLPDNLRSFTFEGELVLNPDYRQSQYENYRPNPQASLPPYCKLQNLALEFRTP